MRRRGFVRKKGFTRGNPTQTVLRTCCIRAASVLRREGATRLEAPRPEMWSKAGPWGDFLVASALGARSESVTSLEDETLASPRVQEATAQRSEMG